MERQRDVCGLTTSEMSNSNRSNNYVLISGQSGQLDDTLPRANVSCGQQIEKPFSLLQRTHFRCFEVRYDYVISLRILYYLPASITSERHKEMTWAGKSLRFRPGQAGQASLLG